MTDELTKEFLVESFEYLDQLDQLLLDLEQNPQDGQLLAPFSAMCTPSRAPVGFWASAGSSR